MVIQAFSLRRKTAALTCVLFIEFAVYFYAYVDELKYEDFNPSPNPAPTEPLFIHPNKTVLDQKLNWSLKNLSNKKVSLIRL